MSALGQKLTCPQGIELVRLVGHEQTFVHFNSGSSLDCGKPLDSVADCPNAW
jgi:hypothetical protein